MFMHVQLTILYFYLPDTIIMVWHYKKIGDACYLLHHAASVYAYYYVMVSNIKSLT